MGGGLSQVELALLANSTAYHKLKWSVSFSESHAGYTYTYDHGVEKVLDSLRNVVVRLTVGKFRGVRKCPA